jgi:hypothetical protein
MLNAFQKIFQSKPTFAVMNDDLKKIIVTIDALDKPDEVLNGWYDFLKDVVPSLKRQANADVFLKEHGACQYLVEIRKAIASHLYYRTHRHPDPEAIIDLEYEANGNFDYIKQLAYNCMRYESDVLMQSPDHVALKTLREITAN